jgi:hypothetical protein
MGKNLSDIMMLPKGARVRCVNSCSGSYTKGNIYELKEDLNTYTRAFIYTVIDDRGSKSNGWNSYNFELVAHELIDDAIILL